MPRVQRLVPLLGLLLPLACSGEVVTLGHASAGSATADTAPKFAPATLVTELASDDQESDNPTLTSDLLEIYFSSERDGGAGDVDVWTARRASVDEAFSAPEPVSAVNTEEFETSPAVGHDGLELWVGAERDGGLGLQDIWVSRRASRADDWTPLENVVELNSSAKDIPRPLASSKIMPLGSHRGSSGYYETFLAERPSASEPFAEPLELVELEVAGQNSVDGFLSDDGLTLYFNRSPGAGESTGDLFVATRPSRGEPFGVAAPLTSVNTSDDERDPWLSPDGKHLFFSSDRDGTLSIYEALLLEP
jgi:WD40 repeat protein